MDFFFGLCLGLFWAFGILIFVARNKPDELIDALAPFAHASEQMSDMPPDRIIFGQPVLGIGKIATVADFHKAKQIHSFY